MTLRKIIYYVRSSLTLARRLRRRRDLIAVVLDPSRVLRFEDGLVLRVRDRLDLLVVKETLCDDVYGLSQLVAPGLIIDVGAGVGSFAVPAARRFPECRVLAFEPDPLQFAGLLANAATNGGDIEGICAAVGTSGTYLLTGTGARSSTVSPSAGGGVMVRGVPLRDFVGDVAVDLLKIDSEGAELDVLHSLSPRGLDGVARVALEYHNLQGQRQDAMLASLLAGRGFEVRAVPDRYDARIGYLYARRP